MLGYVDRFAGLQVVGCVLFLFMLCLVFVFLVKNEFNLISSLIGTT